MLCINVYADQAQHYFYKLKTGETASFVLHRARLLPLYKKTSGSLDETAVINQQNINNINKLSAGEKIYFTKDQVDGALRRKLIVVSHSLEISFTEKAFELQRLKLSKNVIVPESTITEKIREVASNLVTPAPLAESPKVELTQNAQVIVEQQPKVEPVITDFVKVEPTKLDPIVTAPVQAEQVTAEPVKAEPVITQAQSGNTFSEVAFVLRTGYSSVNGRDVTNNTRAQFLTRLNSQLQFNWIQNWDETTKTSFLLGYKSSHFESDYRGTRIYNSKVDAYKFGFDYEDQLYKKFKYVLGFEQSQELFYRGVTGGLELNAVPLTSFKVGLKKSLLKKGRYELGTNLGYKYTLGSEYQNYTIKNGYSYTVHLYLDESLNSRNINCGVIYGKRLQNTSLLKFSETNLDLSCFYKWAY